MDATGAGARIEHDDNDLVARSRAGDRDAYGELVRRHTARVARIAAAQGVVGHDLDDVVQETFVRAWRSLARFRAGERFDRWLGGVATRTVKDHWRSRSRRRESADGDSIVPFLASAGPDPAGEAVREEERRAVLAALGRLTADQRAAITLYYFEEEPIAAVAETLGWGQSKTKVVLHRARRTLAEILAAQEVRHG